MPEIIAHCGIDCMMAHAEMLAPRGGAAGEGGASAFINKGTNGRWRDALPLRKAAACEARAVDELGPECARWLAGGWVPDPRGPGHTSPITRCIWRDRQDR